MKVVLAGDDHRRFSGTMEVAVPWLGGRTELLAVGAIVHQGVCIRECAVRQEAAVRNSKEVRMPRQLVSC